MSNLWAVCSDFACNKQKTHLNESSNGNDEENSAERDKMDPQVRRRMKTTRHKTSVMDKVRICYIVLSVAACSGLSGYSCVGGPVRR